MAPDRRPAPRRVAGLHVPLIDGQISAPPRCTGQMLSRVTLSAARSSAVLPRWRPSISAPSRIPFQYRFQVFSLPQRRSRKSVPAGSGRYLLGALPVPRHCSPLQRGQLPPGPAVAQFQRGSVFHQHTDTLLIAPHRGIVESRSARSSASIDRRSSLQEQLYRSGMAAVGGKMKCAERP